MKAIILLNGEPFEGTIDEKNATVFCCDGAYGWAKDRIKIDENLGDFDSLSYLPTPPPKEIYPTEKDDTDGEIALLRAIERGFGEIEIYGGGGKRDDHFLGNLHLLYLASERGVNAQMFTNYSRIFVGKGRVQLDGLKGKTLSILPFGGEAHIINSEGLLYSFSRLRLTYGTTRGISNEITQENACFEVEKGKTLVIVNL